MELARQEAEEEKARRKEAYARCGGCRRMLGPRSIQFEAYHACMLCCKPLADLMPSNTEGGVGALFPSRLIAEAQRRSRCQITAY